VRRLARIRSRCAARPLRAWKVRFIPSNLPAQPGRADRWITQRLRRRRRGSAGGEIILGVAGAAVAGARARLDVFHFNEGHAVFAGLELLRQKRFGGSKLPDRITRLRKHVVFTTHTPVPAGNEVHDLAVMRKMDADLGFTDAELEAIGGDPFSMTVAGLRLARLANGVAELHGHTARAMWQHVEGAAPIISITNGVHAPTWQDARSAPRWSREAARAARRRAVERAPGDEGRADRGDRSAPARSSRTTSCSSGSRGARRVQARRPDPRR
jgi:starch phosphorylase